MDFKEVRKMFATFTFFCFALGSTIIFLPSIFGSLTTTAASSHQAGTLNITVRDSLTGRRVAAEVRSLKNIGEGRITAADFGRAEIVGTGRVELKTSAGGYKDIETYFDLDEIGKDVVIWLDPSDVQARLAVDAADPFLNNEKLAVFEGFVFDSNGAAIAGADVEIGEGSVKTRTDANGLFRIAVPVPAFDAANDLPGETFLTVTYNGSVIYRRESISVVGGKTQLIIDTGNETTVFDARDKFRFTEHELSAGFEQPTLARPFFTEAPTAVPVPASIRVGANCATATTCTTVNVFSIDTYTRNGLDDEWIASWNANSLKAGAIAYRSYGSYHVYHPRVPASYDICNTTSCQVNDPTDTNVNSNNATAQTTGSIVTNAAGTDALFSEYSAENNLAPGCPDGSTGRPEFNWPCLADPVDVGTTYFGHGRGMCQWGSQRWSINQGKDFVWIVNHYYNANGNPSGLRTGVLQMGPDTLLPPPSLTEPGNQTAPGLTVSTLTPTFRWDPVVGATGYSLYVSKFNGSTYDVVYNSETALGQPITATEFSLPAGILVADGQYRWNMSSYITAGYGTPNFFRNYFTVNPTATVSGRVTSPSGSALRNATVSITDAQGVRRTATTSSFGIYSFTGVAVGQSQTITATTKRYRFTPLVVTLSGSVSNMDLVGLE